MAQKGRGRRRYLVITINVERLERIKHFAFRVGNGLHHLKKLHVGLCDERCKSIPRQSRFHRCHQGLRPSPSFSTLLDSHGTRVSSLHYRALHCRLHHCKTMRFELKARFERGEKPLVLIKQVEGFPVGLNLLLSQFILFSHDFNSTGTRE